MHLFWRKRQGAQDAASWIFFCVQNHAKKGRMRHKMMRFACVLVCVVRCVSDTAPHNANVNRDNTLDPDSLQLEATFENIFAFGCSKQRVLTKIDTNYMDTMNHILKLEVCDLPHVQLSISPDEKEDTMLALALYDHGERPTQNYSLNLQLKASSAVQIGFNGKYMSSPAIRQLLLEGKFHDNDKWTMSASSEQRCFQLKFGQHMTDFMDLIYK
ncbi:unnamed protein product [Ranitomeya imitator]|uniref:Uncharacterized protein n=1 Tax=Ranitomeya imitator TaxID=111125 RepID=A0ABN9KQ30_9NEOB|nr:unnamed protein product [Ranitomeya imitator]